MSITIKGIVRKTAASLTMAATVLSLAGFAAMPIAAQAVAPADYGLLEGDTISASGSSDPDIYIVNEHGYKRLFVNPAIFTLYGHLSWAGVKSVAPATRDAFGTSGLFRVNGDTKVYGLDVISEDVANLRWVNTSGAQAVIDDPNFFKKVFVINEAEKALYGMGADYTSVLQVPVYSRGGGAVSGPIGASLSSDNPASGTLVQGQASADLAHFTFSGNGSVTNIVLDRLGVSADATLTNVYLYDGSKRLTDSATVSSGKITFNDSQGLFQVSGSKTISVKSDILSTATGETIGVRLSSYTPSSASVIVTSLSGNLHSIATATLATVVLAADASTTPSANTALDPADDIVIFQNTATVGVRYVWLKSLQFRVIGSVNVGDLQNFRLYADGVQVGSAQSQTDANGYVVFDVSGSPKKLETGGRVLKVLANVVGGSNKNFTVSIRQAPDISTSDSQYNAGVLATQTGSFPAEAGQQTISQGTLTITKKTDSPAGDVVKDASGVVLARFEFKANGERLKVENLRVSNTSSPDQFALRNGALFADGVQIGSTQTIWEDSSPVASSAAAYTEFSLGSSLIVEPGHPKIVEIRADIFDASGTNNVAANATITANLVVGSSNVQRLVSLNYFNSAATVGNQVTVKTGSFSAAKYTGYANQSVVTPKTLLKLGHYTLTAASSENINVNTLVLDLDGTNDGSVASKTTDVFLKVYSDSGSLLYTSPAKATVSSTASSSYSVNLTIPVNKTYQVEVWGNLDTVALTSKTLITHLLASGVTANSSTATSTSEVVGQTITTQSGALNVQTASYPAAALRVGGTTASTYAFGLQPQYDDFTLDEVYVDIASDSLGVGMASSSGAVATLILKDGASLNASTVLTLSGTLASASFTGLNYSLPQARGTKTLTVDVQFAGVGIGGNDTGGNVTVRLDGLKYRSSGGTITQTYGRAPATNTGNANLVHKAYPVFANLSLPTSVMAAGENTLAKVSASSVGGTVGLYRIVWTVAVSAGPQIASASNFKLLEDGIDVTSSLGSFATASYNFNKATGGTGQVAYTFTAERPISSAKVYELVGTVSGTLAANNTISTKIANPKTTVASAVTDDAVDVAGTLGATSASVVWTDQSSATHSLTSTDWMNDFLIKTINVSQVLTK
ncbi:MAG: hypothetical protein AAB375_00620 [Patescibacteria group bacterium]